MGSVPTNTDLVCVGPVKRGRPEIYSEEIGREICERIACGESLNRICADEHMPARPTVNKWLITERYSDFVANYATSRMMQADAFADEIHDIADDLKLLPDHKRVMIDARKWRAARQNWRSWGDKVKHEHEITPATPNGAEQLPPGLAWLAGQLPASENNSSKSEKEA